MIDENKEQLRNLFRNYNVLDVQPAISVRLPDDMSALQVVLGACSPATPCPGRSRPLMPGPAPPDGDHRPGHSPLPGGHALHPHELVLQDRVSDPHSLPRDGLTSPAPGTVTEAGRQGPEMPAQSSLLHQPLFLLPSRHKRKLKAIVAGSTGEQGLGGGAESAGGAPRGLERLPHKAGSTPLAQQGAPLPSMPQRFSLQGTVVSSTSWTCPTPTSIPSMGEWGP